MNNYIIELKKDLKLPKEIVDDISTEIETHIYYSNFMDRNESIETNLGPAKELAKNINNTKTVGMSKMIKLGSTKKLFAYFLVFNMLWLSFIVLTNITYIFGMEDIQSIAMIFLQRLISELSMLLGLIYILSYFLLYIIAVRKFKSHTQIALVTFVSSLIVFGGAVILKFIFRFTPIYSLFMIDPMFEYAIFLNTIILPSVIIGKEYYKKAKGRNDSINNLNEL